MTESLKEYNEVPVAAHYDVIVVGGGVAGASAALAARRNGSKTLLIEKSVMLGGLATLGHVVIYLPLCDGKGRKVIGGISEELLHLSIKYGYDNLPEEWKDLNLPKTGARYRTHFNAPAFVVALDEIMEKEGVDLLFDTVFCSAIMEDKYCKGIIVENKSGRRGYTAEVVVDTTGDADVMVRAGASYEEGENNLSYWGYYSNLESMQRAIDERNIFRAINIKALGSDDAGRGHPEGFKKFKGINGEEVTEFILEGRKLLRKDMIKQDKWQSSIIALSGMAQYRMTRRIKGYYELTEKDVFKYFEDSIGCTGDWRKPGPVYEIPYRTLISPQVKNVITGGRTIASPGDVWQVTRVIPTASLTGQAAGTAAALAIKKGCDLKDIDINELQENLKATGVVLHY